MQEKYIMQKVSKKFEFDFNETFKKIRPCDVDHAGQVEYFLRKKFDILKRTLIKEGCEITESSVHCYGVPESIVVTYDVGMDFMFTKMSESRSFPCYRQIATPSCRP